MRIKISLSKRLRGGIFLSLMLVIFAATGVDAREHRRQAGSVSDHAKPAFHIVYQDSQQHLGGKSPCMDWHLAEVIKDIPHVELVNSLSLWIPDHTRNPFYVFNTSQAP